MKRSGRTLYGLHAGNGEIRYVGSTSRTLAQRLHDHLQSRWCAAETPLVLWLRALRSDDLCIEEIAKGCTVEDEMAEIGRRAGVGERLLNVIGGSAKPTVRAGRRLRVDAERHASVADSGEVEAWALRAAEPSRREMELVFKQIGDARRAIRPREPRHPHFGRRQEVA